MNILLEIPVPRDIPLPLPLPEWLLVGLLVFSFLLHILFVNLMVGGTFLTLWAEIKGLKNKDYDNLAREISKTITVNKSLAVVLGVAPLLSINTLYTLYFYSANSLTGSMWISIVPIVTAAFLAIFLHKYTWDSMKSKKLHISLAALAALLFLFVPLIFLTNINLMLFPEEWGSVSGFFSAMMLANVFPRYLHFLCASFAVTGIFLFWYMRRKKYPFDAIFDTFKRPQLLRNWYKLALYASMIQAGLGLLVYFTLPDNGLSMQLINLIVFAAVIAIISMALIWLDLRGSDEKLGRHFYKIAIGLAITVTFMGTIRHVYRAVALEPHQKMVAAETAEFLEKSHRARMEAEAEMNIQAVKIKVIDELSIWARTQIMDKLKNMKGIESIDFNLQTNIIVIKYFADEMQPGKIKESLKKMNFTLAEELTRK